MKKVTIILNGNKNKRIEFGVVYIQESLDKLGYVCEMVSLTEKFEDYRKYEGKKIYIGNRENDKFIEWLEREELLLYHGIEPKTEGFYLETCPNQLTVISGGNDVGTLYGCLELAERIQKESCMPANLAYYDAPAFKLRGPCVGLQKTKIEPPRLTYEYPITKERFPWFYDKLMWTKFLDKMLKYRCNVLYIWSGHPFSSLVKVEDYPEALEVTEEEFLLNKEVFGWLTEECDRRGIWVVLKFYNIHIPYPFAKKHGLEQRQSNINPMVQDYTKKSIIEFVKSFPHIGLMVCLGEALRGNQNKTDWFVQTILPAVKEGMKQAGLKEEPPIILRGHDCDPFSAMERGKKIYSNLYTMWKYNGEGLTTYFPRGEWQKMHQKLSAIGTTHILNVHILADLEPFRYQAPIFIMRCIQAGKSRLGGNGLHLYPLFYWDWPYSPDKVEPRLEQMDRDWIWYEAWFRYAWNSERNEKDEKVYWIHRISEHFNCEEKGAALLLDAMEKAGQCAPKILGRIGITEGNRQTFSLGMTMSQITNVDKYRPNRALWNSVARRGEQPEDYIKKELKGQAHIGETPYDMIEEVYEDAGSALEKCREAQEYLPQDAELTRICDDIQAIYHICDSYCNKLMAAMSVLEYKYTMNEKFQGNMSLLERAAVCMEKSLQAYREVTALTSRTYLYANSMQTPQRKIPFPDGELYGHWAQCLPEYEKEYENFCKNIKGMKECKFPQSKNEVGIEIEALPQAEFKLISEDCQCYEVKKGNSIVTDNAFIIQDMIPEINGLTGIRISSVAAETRGVSIKFELKEDSQILIGYMRAKAIQWLQVPDLETDTHADDRGGLAVVYENALNVNGCPPIDIHAFRYEKGSHELFLGTGCYTIVGVISQNVILAHKNANLNTESLETLDWLYE